MNDTATRVDDAIEAGAADAEIERLAKLSTAEYEKQRKGAAKRLGLRSSILDKLVDGERARLGLGQDDGLQGTAIEHPMPEPWGKPVDGAALLDEIAAAVRRHIILSDHALIIIALWTVHTFITERFSVSPKLFLRSPTMGCGKSTVLDVLDCLVARPHMCAAGITRPQRARKVALQAYVNASGADTQSRLELLLGDVRDIFMKLGCDRLSSVELIEELVKVEPRPWAEYGKSGKPITQNKLAWLLKGANLGIAPEVIRTASGTPRGYLLSQFAEAFERYLSPLEGSTDRNSATNADGMGISEISRPQQGHPDVAVQKCKKSNNNGLSCGVTVQKGAERTKERPDLSQPVAARPATNGKGGPGRFFDAQGKPTDDPELGYYGRVARAPIDAAYEAATEKHASLADDSSPQPTLAEPAARTNGAQHQAATDAVADAPDQAEKTPPAQPDQPVSAPDPVPARPVLEGDRRREAIRARNQAALQQLEAKIKERLTAEPGNV
jgi:hypothetical protein